ncbi:hypothetical protein V8D89_014329, partial [Ganoderma adspersum]
MSLAKTCHRTAARELGIPFIAECQWFTDLGYSTDAEGKLIITVTKKHDPVPLPLSVVKDRLCSLLE